MNYGLVLSSGPSGSRVLQGVVRREPPRPGVAPSRPPRRSPRRRSLPLVLSLVGTLGCGSQPEREHDPTHADVNTLTQPIIRLSSREIVGSLAYGATSAAIRHGGSPIYRAFTFNGSRGDVVEARVSVVVRPTGIEQDRAWILDSGGRILAEVGSSSEVVLGPLVLPSDGAFRIAFRETLYREATSTVTLTLRGKSVVGGPCAAAPLITPEWQLSPVPAPAGTLVFDEQRGRLLSVGASATSALSGTNVWTPLATKALPPNGTAVAYNSKRGTVLVFGGQIGFTHQNTLFEFDGSTWSEIKTAGYVPRPRSGAAMAYDEARDRLVLFGGLDSAELFQDTWEFDGSTWKRVTTPTAPAAGFGLRMAYDRARSRLVLVERYQPGAQTWEWSGGTWQLAPGGSFGYVKFSGAPLPLVYDSRRGRIVRLEPRSGEYVSSGDRGLVPVEWDGTRWSDAGGTSDQFSVSDGSGSTFSAAYDPVADRLLLASAGGFREVFQHVRTVQPNRSPLLDPQPAREVYAGDELALNLRSLDPDRNPVTYSATGLPAGATLDADTGAFRFTPTPAQKGGHTLTLRVSDSCLEGTTPLQIRVLHLDYPDFPRGAVAVPPKELAVKGLGTLSSGGSPTTVEMALKLRCGIQGTTPGKLSVACEGLLSTATSLTLADHKFYAPSFTLPLAEDLTFKLPPQPGSTPYEVAGSVEPLYDGTWRLYLSRLSAWITYTTGERGTLSVMPVSPPRINSVVLGPIP